MEIIDTKGLRKTYSSFLGFCLLTHLFCVMTTQIQRMRLMSWVYGVLLTNLLKQDSQSSPETLVVRHS